MKVSSQLLAGLTAILTAVVSVPSLARPVSYVGGLAVMNENRAYQNEAMVAYTWQRQAALGLHVSTYRTEVDSPPTTLAAPLCNLLLGRWNKEGQQSNIYLGIGYGGVLPAHHRAGNKMWDEVEGATLVIMDADTETRDLYASIHQERAEKDENSLIYSRLRLGYSPFLAGMNSLHIWMLMQVDYDQWRQAEELTPMLRFFYQNVLWEIGSSFKGHMQFNWTAEI